MLMRPSMQAIGVAGVAAAAGFVAVHHKPSEPVVITLSPRAFEENTIRVPRGVGVLLSPDGQPALVTPQQASVQVPCSSPAPDAVSTCVNGFWQAPGTAAGGAGRIDLANGCVTMPPMNDMTCRNGVWSVRGTETTVQNSAPVPPPTTASVPPPVATSGVATSSGDADRVPSDSTNTDK